MQVKDYIGIPLTLRHVIDEVSWGTERLLDNDLVEDIIGQASPDHIIGIIVEAENINIGIV